MPKLELLRLSNNRIPRVPQWLLHELPALSWLALAGNPALLPPAPRASLEPIRLDMFALEEKLGEGTSGNVHKARRLDPAAGGLSKFLTLSKPKSYPKSVPSVDSTAGNERRARRFEMRRLWQKT